MTTHTLPLQDITGLLLAGGRGSRMGGVDKGLQNYRGMPMALHSLLRLQPQVGHMMINANRNIAAYEALGAPVWPDVVADYAGPLAGMQAGLEHCETPWLVTIPCDTPDFPLDLVSRLAQGLVSEGAQIAIAATRGSGAASGDSKVGPDGLLTHPVFCLIDAMLLESLNAFIASGQRKIDRWTGQHRCATVVFDDERAFFNVNTPEELRLIQRAP